MCHNVGTLVLLLAGMKTQTNKIHILMKLNYPISDQQCSVGRWRILYCCDSVLQHTGWGLKQWPHPDVAIGYSYVTVPAIHQADRSTASLMVSHWSCFIRDVLTSILSCYAIVLSGITVHRKFKRSRSRPDFKRAKIRPLWLNTYLSHVLVFVLRPTDAY